jgi:transposase-like protein
VAEYGTTWPKAVAKLTDDLDVLLEFYNYPAEHWVHLRTTNPTLSLSSGPEPGSRRASWSNVPTNQEAISKSHDTPIRRS